MEKGFFMFSSRSISRILYQNNVLTLIIYLSLQLPAYFSCLPSNIVRVHSNVSLHGIAPHRVYLISLQLNLYILSVALFLTSRWMAVNQYDYTMVSGLSSIRKANSDKAIYWLQNYELIVNKSI